MNTNNAAMIAPPKTTANTLTPMATGLDKPPVLLLPLLGDPAAAPVSPPAAAVEDDDVTGRTAEPVVDDPDDPVLPVCVALLEETPTLVGVVLTLFDLLEVALALLEGDVGVVELDACSDVDDEPALDVVDDVDPVLPMSLVIGRPSLARATLRLLKLI